MIPKCKDCCFHYKNGYGTLLCHAWAYRGASIPNPAFKRAEHWVDEAWCEDERNITGMVETCERARENTGIACGPNAYLFVKATWWEKILIKTRFEYHWLNFKAKLRGK